jgi:hypothetical protein
MPAIITPSLRSSLERLKHAGSVSGLALFWQRQLLINLTPFEEFRVARCMETLADARNHFRRGEREIESLWFAYEGVNLVTVHRGDTSLVILHTRAHEADFLTQAAATFLEDTQLLIAAVLNPAPPDGGGVTERLAANA